VGLVRLRGWRRKRRHHSEGHRAKVGEKGVDGVPVLEAAKRPPKLQVTTHSEDRATRTSKVGTLNDKLIVDGPKCPGKHPNAQPPNVAVSRSGGMDFRQ
jgi:hypothetical protein